MKYLISVDKDLDLIRLGKILNEFQTKDRARLQGFWDYYQGKQKIRMKQPADTGRPCNKCCVNYCYNITQNFLGYMTGLPIKYDNDNFDEVLDILRFNDFVSEDSEFLRMALIYGVAYEINYIDEESKQRFKVLDSRECIPIYWNNMTNDLAYVVRFYKEDLLDIDTEQYMVEVYGKDDMKLYRSTPGFNSFQLLEERPNYYNQVPITVFKLNEDEEPCFEKIMDLQDAYNEVYSSSIDNIQDWAQAYLILKGITADAEDLTDAKEKRAFCIDADADISYLTKSVSDTDIQNVLKLTSDHIHSIAQSPDFTDKDFMSQSGIAIRYKLIGFENKASSIESFMRKAITKRIELIASVLKLTSDRIYSDVKLTFTRNLPQSLDPTSSSELMAYKGLVSNETLLGQIPFVENVDEELDRVAEQTEASMALYNFSNISEDDDEQVLDEQRDKEKTASA